MITNDKQLKQTREQLAHLEEDLATLQKEIYAVNPQRFHLMAEAYIDHIMDLRRQIDEYIGVKTYQDELKGLWIRLTGPSIQLGTASVSLLTGTLETFRKSIRGIASALKGEIPRRGRVSMDIEKSCDLVIIGLSPGSMRIGLGLPPEQQLYLFEKAEEQPVLKALDTFMEVASWASSYDPSLELPSSIANLGLRDFILRQVINMTPSKNMPIEAIEFSGNLVHVAKPPQLTKKSRESLQNIITKKIEGETTEVTGTIREIDLDYLKFYLRERPNNEPNLHCEVTKEMIDDAQDALGVKVKVAGILEHDAVGKIKILKVRNIETVADEEVE